MSDELSSFTDHQLQQELAKREEERKNVELNRRRNRADFLASKINALLTIQPEHSRTSCSDENPANEHRGCVRCYLLAVQSHGCWDYDKDLNLSITTLPEL